MAPFRISTAKEGTPKATRTSQAQARKDDAPKFVRTESVSPEGIEVVNFAPEDKPHTPLGADEFGMPILPVPAKVVLVVPIYGTDSDSANTPEEVVPALNPEPSTVAVVTEDGLVEVPTAKSEKPVKKAKAIKTKSAPAKRRDWQ